MGWIALLLLAGYIFINESNKRREPADTDIRMEFIPEMPVQKTITYDLPENLDFAGEGVPLEIQDVRERLDQEIHRNIYWHSTTIFLIKRANKWLPQIEKVLVQQGIPSDFKYLPIIESSLIESATSVKGAVGFWQFLEGTAGDFGLEVNKYVDERRHPIKSTEAAVKYLKKAYEKFGNWTLVAASYNRGMRGIERSLSQQQVQSYYELYLNRETSQYMFKILSIKEIIENQERYGFEIPESHLYQQLPTRTLEVTETIDDLIAFSKEEGSNYKLLKRHNPWLREDKLPVKKGKSYKIVLPVNL